MKPGMRHLYLSFLKLFSAGSHSRTYTFPWSLPSRINGGQAFLFWPACIGWEKEDHRLLNALMGPEIKNKILLWHYLEFSHNSLDDWRNVRFTIFKDTSIFRGQSKINRIHSLETCKISSSSSYMCGLIWPNIRISCMSIFWQ